MTRPLPLRIAVDGMGGDGGPSVVVEALRLALQRLPDLTFLLFGDKKVLEPLVSGSKVLSENVTLCHAAEVVLPDMSPVEALRTLKQSSMRLALEAVKEGQADAAVSAGNTGAYLALAKFVLKTISGVARPAIISTLPTQKGECVFLDLGGNLECQATHLIDFALMGHVFARRMLFRNNPRVGLLNVGSESVKGLPRLKSAAQVLEKILPDFYGFVEGHDLTRGVVDVVVTDGFSGNIALKTGEGVFDLIMHALRRCFSYSWRNRLAYFFAKPVLKTLKLQLDPRRYNGALWIGLEGVAVKSHGHADALGFSYAVEMAADSVRFELDREIAEVIEKMQTLREDLVVSKVS